MLFFRFISVIKVRIFYNSLKFELGNLWYINYSIIMYRRVFRKMLIKEYLYVYEMKDEIKN